MNYLSIKGELIGLDISNEMTTQFKNKGFNNFEKHPFFRSYLRLLKDVKLSHFGSSKYFLIYEFDLETKDLRFLKRIENSTQEEEKHGDIKKAKSVSELLENVSVFVANRYGPNIKRIKRRFIPIISREKNIEKTLNKVKLYSNKIEIEKENRLNKEIIFIKREEIANW
jgi:predicted Fe-Mo cluster-binding NifX family protein